MDLEIQLGKGDSQRNFICRDHAEMYLDSWNYLQTSSISADNCRNLRPAGKDGQEDFIKVLCCNGTIKIFLKIISEKVPYHYLRLVPQISESSSKHTSWLHFQRAQCIISRLNKWKDLPIILLSYQAPLCYLGMFSYSTATAVLSTPLFILFLEYGYVIKTFWFDDLRG